MCSSTTRGGEGDTMVVERERDLTLSAQARQTIADIETALGRLTTGHYGYSTESGPPHPARAFGSNSLGHDARRGEGRRDRPPMTDDAEAGMLSTTPTASLLPNRQQTRALRSRR